MSTEILRNRVFLLLWLMAIHSFLVALGLIFLPTKLLPFFGFLGYSGRFFQMQSGVFHIVMSCAYLMAAYQLKQSTTLVQFAVSAKSIATVFLLTIFIFYESNWVILLSAIGDGSMAMILFLLLRTFKKSQSTTVKKNE